MLQNKRTIPLSNSLLEGERVKNRRKRGSILIYTLFLSSFLVLFFISFQGELEKTLDRTKESESSMEDISGKQDALMSLKSSPAGATTVSSNEYFSLTSLTQSGSVFKQSIGGTESDEYWITATDGSTNLGISILSGGPIYYRLAAFNSGSESSATIVGSGLVSTSTTIGLSGTLERHILVIEGLGGYAKYSLDTRNTTTTPSSSSYRGAYDVKGYTKNDGVYELVHFTPKSYSGMPYESLGMYLKE